MPAVAVAVVHAAMEVLACEVTVSYDVLHDYGNAAGAQYVAAPHGDVGTLVRAVDVHVVESGGSLTTVLPVKGTKVADGAVVAPDAFRKGRGTVKVKEWGKNAIEPVAAVQETI